MEKNLERNQAVGRNISLCKQHLTATGLSNNSSVFFDGEGYWALAEMGPSIVALVMLEYYEDPSGWWFDLLHELVHGERSASPVVFKSELSAAWRTWFGSGEWMDLPKGRGKAGDELYRYVHAPGSMRVDALR